MRQKTYNKVDDLITAATQLSAGAAIHTVSLGLVTATKPIIDAEISAITNTVDGLAQGRHDLRAMRTTLATQIGAGAKVANTIRDSLKRTFGNSYNPLWEGTPFKQTLEVPRSAGRLEQMLRSLKVFLTDYPSHELAGVATAAIAEAAADALGSARTAVQNQKSVVRGMRTTRLQKEKLIRRRIRMVVEELKSVLGPIDARWEAFGLNQPGLKQTPPQPGKITVILLGNGKAAVKWTRTPRADRYRVWLKAAGSEEPAVAVGNPADLDFTIENLTVGTEVEVSISAVNNGGESPRSEAYRFTVQ